MDWLSYNARMVVGNFFFPPIYFFFSVDFFSALLLGRYIYRVNVSIATIIGKFPKQQLDKATDSHSHYYS